MYFLEQLLKWDALRQWEDKPDWERILAKDISDKKLLSKMYKELKNRLSGPTAYYW